VHSGPVEFAIQTPDVDTASHVASSLARGLPSADDLIVKDHLSVVANGPTALQLNAPPGPLLAVNGALRLFTGCGPTYWAACDPQQLVVNFLDDPPENTKYLIASKCHPDVFDRLKNRDVYIWHVEDQETEHLNPVPTAVSITLCAIQLFARLGVKRFDTWGWDGCYLDGRSHAAEQAHNVNDRMIGVGPAVYHTTPTWAAEADDACQLFIGADYEVNVHGGGMFGAILDYRRAAERGG